jgi:hypothetical protein
MRRVFAHLQGLFLDPPPKRLEFANNNSLFGALDDDYPAKGRIRSGFHLRESPSLGRLETALRPVPGEHDCVMVIAEWGGMRYRGLLCQRRNQSQTQAGMARAFGVPWAD